MRRLVRWHAPRSAAPVGPSVVFATAIAIVGALFPVPGVEASMPSTTNQTAALTTARSQPVALLATASMVIVPVPGTAMTAPGLPAGARAAAEIEQPDVPGLVEDVSTLDPLNVRLSAETTSPGPALTADPSSAAGSATSRHAASWRVAPIVTWYGPGFYGHGTACGLRYTRELIGVAHRTLPCGTLIQFQWHGMTAVAPVVDRGPYASKLYVFDWSAGLACHVFRPHGVTNSCYTRHGVKWRVVGKVKLHKWVAAHNRRHRRHK